MVSKLEVTETEIFDPDRLSNLEKAEVEDVHVFSQFMKPGIHSVIIFDPQSKNFYYK